MMDGVRSDGYYRFFPGDYMRDTADLSMTEDGAYRRLLDAYYAEGRLTSDKERLYRIARALSPKEKGAVDFVVGRFFQVSEDHLLQNRVERELTLRRAFHEEQTRKGRLSGEARRRDLKGTDPEPELNRGSNPGSTGVQPGHEPGLNQASASVSRSRSKVKDTVAPAGATVPVSPVKQRPKAKPKTELADQAEKVVGYYEELIREHRPSRYRARDHVVSILKSGVRSEVLWECINEYEPEATRAEVQFRKVAGNFFGRDAVYKAYLDAATAEVVRYDEEKARRSSVQ